MSVVAGTKTLEQQVAALLMPENPAEYGVTLSMRLNGAFVVVYEPPPGEENNDISRRSLFAHIRAVLDKQEAEEYRRDFLARPDVAMEHEP